MRPFSDPKRSKIVGNIGMAPFPHIAGSASAMMGFIQMGGVQAVTVDTTASAGTALIASTTDLTLVATTTNTKGNQLIYGISYGTNSTTSANVYWVVGNLL